MNRNECYSHVGHGYTGEESEPGDGWVSNAAIYEWNDGGPGVFCSIVWCSACTLFDK